MPRRGENIYKRKDGRWEARYVKEITADGKKKYGSVYASSYKEVKAKQQLYILQPTENHNPIRITVTELIAEWMSSMKNQVKPCTYQKYECVCRNHIISDLGTIAVRYISRFTIMSFTERLLEKNLSTKTVNDILLVLALKYAQESYSITVPKINYVKEHQREMRVFSVQEQQNITEYLLKQIDIHKFGVLLTLYTGMRIGELCALRWDDITDEYIVINKTMMRIKNEQGKTEVKIGSPKSESSNRIIPTPKCLLPMINQFRSDGYVLSSDNLKYTEPRLMQIKFGQMVVACNVEKTNFHTLRHTFATRCIEAGVDVKTLSELLGHADVKTTLNRYVHSSFGLKQKSMEQLEMSLIS
ncbi:MAG: tyrosine-type recombinase/integrase [Ruminococcus sp.]